MKLITKRKLIIATVIFSGGLIALYGIAYKLGNTTVSYYDSVEYSTIDNIDISPCEANKLTSNQAIEFVFTKPFTSLSNYENAEIVKKVAINNGTANLSLLPGKYGLYAEFKNGDKQLYNDLILENPKNDSPRGGQGPWYIVVGPLKNSFSFRTSIAC